MNSDNRRLRDRIVVYSDELYNAAERIGAVELRSMSKSLRLMERISVFGAGPINAGDVIYGPKGPGKTIDPDNDSSWRTCC